ncbi:MAG TPA: hypothetical protein VL588_04740 [Bdellovibrionota bacterium]|jgi:hypothetical protein|nr:hypothetical protein [Bdellovibrionota bacterium]
MRLPQSAALIWIAVGTSTAWASTETILSARVRCHGPDGPKTFLKSDLHVAGDSNDGALERASTEDSLPLCGVSVEIGDDATALLVDHSTGTEIRLGTIHPQRFSCNWGSDVPDENGDLEGVGSSPIEPGVDGASITVTSDKVKGCYAEWIPGGVIGIPIMWGKLVWNRLEKATWRVAGAKDTLTLEITNEAEYENLPSCLARKHLYGRWNRSCEVKRN